MIDTPRGRRVGERLLISGEVHVPHLVTIETTSVIRKWSLSHQIDARLARRALVDLADFAAVRHPHEPYLERAWELRDNVSAYDAIYVALAEALDAALMTCDARLARAPLAGMRIDLIRP